MANSPSGGVSRSDAELVDDFVGGNEAAFEQIFYRYSPLVFAVAMRALGDREQAEDVVENVFSQAATHLARLREPAKLRAWLLAVETSEVSHLIRSLVRERRRRERAAQVRDAASVDPGNDEAGYAAEVLNLARASLSPDDQVLLGLVLADTPGTELAEALGVDVRAANTRKSRLYDRLRSTIEVYWIARPRAGRCPDLEALLAGRPEQGLSRSTCQAIERHSRDCERCRDEKRRVVPLALLGLAPLPAFDPHEAWKLVDHAKREVAPRSNWRGDGFPKPPGGAAIRPLAVAAAALAIVSVAGIALGLHLSGQPTAGHHAAPPATTTTQLAAPAAPLSVGGPTTTTTSATTTTLAARAATTTSTSTAPPTTVAAPAATGPTAKTVPSTTLPKKPKKKPPPPPPPTTTVSPALIVDSGPIDLGQTTTSASISFHANTGPVTWSATTADSWLSVSPSSGTLAPGSEGSIGVAIDRTNAPAGSLSSTISITSSDGAATVTVEALELAGPTLSSLGASPNPVSCVSQATATVTVSAPAGVQSATISYAQGSGSAQTAPMSASGSTYSAIITPTSCRALPIQWSVTIVDGDGKTASGSGPTIQVLS